MVNEPALGREAKPPQSCPVDPVPSGSMGRLRGPAVYSSLSQFGGFVLDHTIVLRNIGIYGANSGYRRARGPATRR